MDDNLLGETTLESMPEKYRGNKKPNNNWSILLLIIIAGLFISYYFFTNKSFEDSKIDKNSVENTVDF